MSDFPSLQPTPTTWRIAAGPLAVAFCLFVFAAAMTDPAGIEKPAGHDSVICSRCHVLTASTESSYYPQVDFNSQCRSCHAETLASAKNQNLGFHAGSEADCVRCHSFHEPARISLNDTEIQFDFANSARTSQCISCHGEGTSLAALSSGHRAAAELYHSDQFRGLTASQSCLICHSESAGSLTGSLGRVAQSAPRFSEHGTHPVGVPVIAGSGRPGNKIRSQLDHRVRLYNGNIECQTCHDLTARTEARLVPFDSSNDFCRGCHDPE